MSRTDCGRWVKWGLATTGALLVATLASAQGTETKAPRMPLWDASGAVALHNIRASDAHGGEDQFDWWEPQWETGVQAGRYLTPHLKVEMGVRGPMQYDFYESAQVPAPGLSGGVAFASIDRHVRLVSFAPGVTWQFFENRFVHPYVSAGVSFDVAEIHRSRDAHTVSVSRSNTTIRYSVPAVDTRETLVDARPFLAAGTKSYFNRHWFVRPEAHVALAGSRVGQVSLRLGVGVDF